MSRGRRIAVVGGGLMGVALALRLARGGADVTLYEAEDRLGGLSTWEDFGPFVWDRFYHCILPTDADLIRFLGEIGLAEELRWNHTSTGVYIDGRIYPLDTAFDFARFSALTLLQRARLAFTLVRCALVRDVRRLEGTTAEEWFVRVGGRGPYERIWLPLLRAKFGEAADRVSPVFLVAKVKRMMTARKDVAATESLGYVRGGYRTVWERAGRVLAEAGVRVELSRPVTRLEAEAGGGVVVHVSGAEPGCFDRAVLTVPFETARAMADGWPGGNPVPSIAGVDYMGLVCLILALRREVVPNYVTNIADPGLPFTGIICMTDLVDPAEVGGNSLVYVPKYVTPLDPALAATDDDVYTEFLPAIRRIYPDLAPGDVAAWFVRRAEVVQPVQGIGYSHSAPQPVTTAPVVVVNNAQLLETDLNNGKVVEHAERYADAILADAWPRGATPAGRSAPALKPLPPTVRFVLPAYNESAGIAELISRIASVMRGEPGEYRIYVVDDGSTDQTADAVRAATGDLPVTLIVNEHNLGLGGALRRGLRAATADSSAGDVIVTMDADLTHDPRFLPRMVDRYRQGPDVVIASRFQPGAVVVGVTRLRRFLTWGARFFYGTLVPVPGVRDYSCGYRLYSAATLTAAFDRLGDDFVSERGFACMVEILAKLRRTASFGEVPFVLRYDDKLGASQMRITPTILAYLRVIRRAWLTERSQIPAVSSPTPAKETPSVLGVRAHASSVALLAAVVALGVAGQVLLKTGVAGIGGDAGLTGTLGQALVRPATLAGIASYGLSAVLWLAVLTRLKLSVAYPLGASSYVFVVFAAFVMGEQVPALRWGGVALIVLGIALIGAGFRRGGGEPS